MNNIELRNFRENLRISRKDFAEQLGVSEATIVSWENGRRNIPGPKQKLIEVVFNTNDVQSTTSVIDEVMQLKTIKHKKTPPSDKGVLDEVIIERVLQKLRPELDSLKENLGSLRKDFMRFFLQYLEEKEKQQAEKQNKKLG